MDCSTGERCFLPKTVTVMTAGGVIQTLSLLSRLKKREKAATRKSPIPARIAVHVNVRPWGEEIVGGHSFGISPRLAQVMLVPGRYRMTI